MRSTRWTSTSTTSSAGERPVDRDRDDRTQAVLNRCWAGLATYVATSAATPKPTRIHSQPETPPPGDHAKRYMTVVHGAKRSPSNGHTHEPKARSTRLPKSHIAMIAKRGPRATNSRKKQHK